MKIYRLSDLRNGTGFRRGAGFVLFDDVKRLHAAAQAMLEKLADLTSDEFSRGAEREERRELASALGLDPGDYSL